MFSIELPPLIKEYEFRQQQEELFQSEENKFRNLSESTMLKDLFKELQNIENEPELDIDFVTLEDLRNKFTILSDSDNINAFQRILNGLDRKKLITISVIVSTLFGTATIGIVIQQLISRALAKADKQVNQK